MRLTKLATAVATTLLLSACLIMGEDLTTRNKLAELERALRASTTTQDEEKAVTEWATYCERFPTHDVVYLVWRDESGAVIDGFLSEREHLPDGALTVEFKMRRGPKFTYQMKARDNALKLDKCK